MSTTRQVVAPGTAPTFPVTAELRMSMPHGIAYSDETCRRGELICWPSWEPAPLPPLDAADCKPVLSLMGAPGLAPRRAQR